MRKVALMLIMLTLWGLSANLMDRKAHCQDSGQAIERIISDSEIVIGDITYRIDPNADFYAADGKTLIYFSNFKEGDEVEYTLDSKGDIVELAKRAR